MEQKSKLVRLDQMTQESLTSRPDDSVHALAEYFKNYHEKIEGDIEYLNLPEKEVQRVLSYNLELPRDTMSELDLDENWVSDFFKFDPEVKEIILSALLDVQLQEIVKSTDVVEIEGLFQKTLVTMNKKVITLAKKIANAKVKDQFKVAITQTSLMVFIAAFKATQPNEVVEFDKFIREFLFFSKEDDKDIYNMRLFYLSEITADYLGIGYVPEEETSPAEAELIAKEVVRSRNEYDTLIAQLKEKYSGNKLHLA